MLKQPTKDEERSLYAFRNNNDLVVMINNKGVSWFLNEVILQTRISTKRFSELLNKKQNPGFISNIVARRRHLPLPVAVMLSVLCKMNPREKVAMYEKIAEGLKSGCVGRVHHGRL